MRYEKKICQKAKDDPKVFWRFVQSKTKIKESVQCIIDDNREIHTEHKCKAELLNAFFQSVFTNEPEKDTIPTFNSRTDLKLDNIKFEGEKYSTSLLTIVLVVLTTANFGGFSNFYRYCTRSQAGKSTGYRPTLKPLCYPY